MLVAGNDNVASVECTVPLPGTRRHGLTVGGLNTVATTSTYDSTGTWPRCSRGGMDLAFGGSRGSAGSGELPTWPSA